jgi:hypothetical protein
MTPRIPWTRIVELAEYIQDEHRHRGAVDADVVLRLVRAILQFQEQLLAGMVVVHRAP